MHIIYFESDHFAISTTILIESSLFLIQSIEIAARNGRPNFSKISDWPAGLPGVPTSLNFVFTIEHKRTQN